MAPRAFREIDRHAARARPAGRAAARARGRSRALETTLRDLPALVSAAGRAVPGGQAADRLPVVARRAGARVEGARRRAVDRPAGVAGLRPRARRAVERVAELRRQRLLAALPARPRRPDGVDGDLPVLGPLVAARARPTLRSRPLPREDRKAPPHPSTDKPPVRRDQPVQKLDAAERRPRRGSTRGSARQEGRRRAMNLRREARWLWPIAGIMVARLLCGGYILNKQRLESPLAEALRAQAGVRARSTRSRPGSGAPVTVAGVTVGQIDGVELRERARRDQGEHGSREAAARLRRRDRRARAQHAAEGHAGAAVARAAGSARAAAPRRDGRVAQHDHAGRRRPSCCARSTPTRATGCGC